VSGHRYTAEEVAFLRDGYRAMQVPELTAAFNARFGTAQGEGAIKAAVSNRKIRCGRPVGNPVGTYIKYTREQAEFIRDGYRTMTIRELTAAFNARFGTEKTESHLKAFTHNHKVRSGRTGRFPKGHVPVNKGTKGLKGPNVTSFREGHVPANRKPLGHERIDTKDGYIHIKVPQQNPYTGFPTRYRPKHVWLWEEHNGPIPDGMVVVFKDSDKLNCVLENLMLVSRSELLRMNQHRYADMPDELKPSVLYLAKLEAKAGISTGHLRRGRPKNQ
jgi:hypothetical protein